jgi:hypothetical protein
MEMVELVYLPCTLPIAPPPAHSMSDFLAFDKFLDLFRTFHRTPLQSEYSCNFYPQVAPRLAAGAD